MSDCNYLFCRGLCARPKAPICAATKVSTGARIGPRGLQCDVVDNHWYKQVGCFFVIEDEGSSNHLPCNQLVHTTGEGVGDKKTPPTPPPLQSQSTHSCRSIASQAVIWSPHFYSFHHHKTLLSHGGFDIFDYLLVETVIN